MDHIATMLSWSWDDLFGMDRPDLERFQLQTIRQRIDELAPRVAALRSQMDQTGVSNINQLEDVVPLLFQHTVYKAYPISLIEKARFDMLTRWFSSVTSIDLSGVDASQCVGIDDWLEAIESATCLRPVHTSGTSGKLSFFPRTEEEVNLWVRHRLKSFEGFGDEPGIKLGEGGLRVPCIIPAPRHGRYIQQRVNKYLEEHVAPSPDQVHTMTEGTLSADLAALSGRIRLAQAKGELARMELSDSMRRALKQYIEDQERQPQETTNFMVRIIGELKGKQVYMVGQTMALLKAAQYYAVQGIYGVFSPDSALSTGGGGKGTALPPDWREQLAAFTGIATPNIGYSMTEITGAMRMCKEGYYHIPPFFVVFLLDPHSGATLPRSGTQTGRFACVDLLPNSYWGGIVSGDKVTVEWDRQCGCARKGPHIHADVTRYSEEVTGDDKITCAATIDNTDDALKALLAI